MVNESGRLPQQVPVRAIIVCCDETLRLEVRTITLKTDLEHDRYGVHLTLQQLTVLIHMIY